MELQIPMVRRILDENPDTEYHVWNFARADTDREWVKTISGERVTVFNGTEEGGFVSPVTTGGVGRQFGAGEHNAAYKHYSQPEFRDHLFVKIDDDIVFLETGRFAKFVEVIDAHRGASIVANIINNGACTPITPGIWERFDRMRIPLLDIHLHGAFADMAHTYLFENWQELINAPIKLVPTEDWLSINAVGYDWQFLRDVVEGIGKPHPPMLAGRRMAGWGRVFGDEGVFQTKPRIIMQGFLAGHLTYGPQNPTPRQMRHWLDEYRRVGEEYLAQAKPDRRRRKLPELSETSHGQIDGLMSDPQYAALVARWGRDNWRIRAIMAGEMNDPCVGRYVP